MIMNGTIGPITQGSNPVKRETTLGMKHRDRSANSEKGHRYEQGSIDHGSGDELVPE